MSLRERFEYLLKFFDIMIGGVFLGLEYAIDVKTGERDYFCRSESLLLAWAYLDTALRGYWYVVEESDWHV